MRKICSNCTHVFEDIDLEYCPLVDCADGLLIEIDEQLVDVIKKLWDRGVSTKYSCAGHLEETCSKPYIMFDGVYLEYFELELSNLRDLLTEMNSDKELVVIDGIEDREQVSTFVVRGKCDPVKESTRERLKSQMEFMEFLYDVIDHLDILIDEVA